MTMQIRLLVEVSDSSDDDGPYIRVDHSETVMPAGINGSPADMVALTLATFDRLQSEQSSESRSQLEQIARLAAQEDAS